jgi:hypothetical protein
MFRKQATEVSARYTKPVRKLFDVAVVESASRDQPQSATNCRRCATPGRRPRRTFGSTSETGAESRFAGSGGAGIKGDVFAFRRDRRTDWPAINARRYDTDEELTIEPRVTRQSCPFTDFLTEHSLQPSLKATVYDAPEFRLARIGPIPSGYGISIIYRSRRDTCI